MRANNNQAVRKSNTLSLQVSQPGIVIVNRDFEIPRRTGVTGLEKPTETLDVPGAFTGMPSFEEMAESLPSIQKSMDPSPEEGRFQVPTPEMVTLLNKQLVNEYKAYLAYQHYAACMGTLVRDAVKSEFEQHAWEEQDHADFLRKKIVALGGRPTVDVGAIQNVPDIRSAYTYLLDLEKSGIVAWKDILKACGENDGLRVAVENYIEVEQGHADDLRRRLRPDTFTDLGPIPPMTADSAQKSFASLLSSFDGEPLQKSVSEPPIIKADKAQKDPLLQANIKHAMDKWKAGDKDYVSQKQALAVAYSKYRNGERIHPVKKSNDGLMIFGFSESDIEKSGIKIGEGSRGGKVVGHTRTGKPIYESHVSGAAGGTFGTGRHEHELVGYKGGEKDKHFLGYSGDKPVYYKEIKFPESAHSRELSTLPDSSVFSLADKDLHSASHRMLSGHSHGTKPEGQAKEKRNHKHFATTHRKRMEQAQELKKKATNPKQKSALAAAATYHKRMVDAHEKRHELHERGDWHPAKRRMLGAGWEGDVRKSDDGLMILSVDGFEKAKGGEGSRGGKVIGHTPSGLPIYEGKHPKLTWDKKPDTDHEAIHNTSVSLLNRQWDSKKDHDKAREMHAAFGQNHEKESNDSKNTPQDRANHRRMAEYHTTMGSFHNIQSKLRAKEEEHRGNMDKFLASSRALVDPSTTPKEHAKHIDELSQQEALHHLAAKHITNSDKKRFHKESAESLKQEIAAHAKEIYEKKQKSAVKKSQKHLFI